MSDVSNYAQHFIKGQKITVCIPMENNELFRDWAIIESLEKDLITLQLSRDQLPVQVRLVSGTRFDLRIEKKGEGYRCAGVFAGGEGLGLIHVRLTGDVVTSELREYFRIDLFLPFRLLLTKEQNLDVLIGTWRNKKQIRLTDEAERREAFSGKNRNILIKIAEGEFDTEGQESAAGKRNLEEFYPIDESWDNVNASAINLSAGGFKFVSTDVFTKDELILVEMFIPSNPPRIMDCIARVVMKNINYSFKADKEHFNIALNFVLIDDRDRDAIISHISRVELQRIRNRGQLPAIDVGKSSSKRATPLMMAIWTTIAIVFLFIFAYYLYMYSNQKIVNEIQDMFGNSVKKYREKTDTQNLWK